MVTQTTLDRLKVVGPLNLTRLKELVFQVAGNRHGTMTLQGYLLEEEGLQASLRGVDGQSVRLLCANEDNELEPVFCGQPTHVQVHRNGPFYVAELTVSSGTAQLDGAKKSRSFQNVSMTYRQVVYTVLGDTPRAAAVFSDVADTPIGKPIIQYQETDWQFLTRLASMLGTQLLPDCTTPNPQFSFGVPGYEAPPFQTDGFTVRLSPRFYELGAETSGQYKADFLCYEAQCAGHYKLGSLTSFQEQPFYVCAQRGVLHRGELVYRYTLGKAALCGQRLIRNRLLTGLSLAGTVWETSGERVKLALDIDSGRAGEYAFPWSPETGNLMYCMPKVGTRATLYLADGDSSNAVALTSPRTNGESCVAMGDAQQRCLVTEHGKQLCLFPESMILAAGHPEDAKPLRVKLDQLNGLFMESPKAVRMVAKHRVSIQAPTVSLNTPRELKTLRSPSQAQAQLALIVPKGTGNPAQAAKFATIGSMTPALGSAAGLTPIAEGSSGPSSYSVGNQIIDTIRSPSTLNSDLANLNELAKAYGFSEFGKTSRNGVYEATGPNGTKITVNVNKGEQGITFTRPGYDPIFVRRTDNAPYGLGLKISNYCENINGTTYMDFNYFVIIMGTLGVKKKVGKVTTKVDEAAKPKEYVTLSQMRQLGWTSMTQKELEQLNRTLEKYDITSVERIRHFLAQTTFESMIGENTREGEYLLKPPYNFTQKEYEDYFNTKHPGYMYTWRGCGYIQTTFKYAYHGYSTKLMEKDHPELQIKYLSFANNRAPAMEQAYLNAIEKLKSAGIDTTEYENIVNLGCDYTAKKYAWDISGFWWDVNNMNSIIDDLTPGDASEVDKVSVKVNEGDRYKDRRDMYTRVCGIIK